MEKEVMEGLSKKNGRGNLPDYWWLKVVKCYAYATIIIGVAVEIYAVIKVGGWLLGLLGI